MKVARNERPVKHSNIIQSQIVLWFQILNE